MTEQVDLEALEALAKAADSWGGWAIWPDLTEGGFVHVGNEDGVIPEGQIATPDDAEANPIAKAYTPEIGAFIAAADPATVLALIAELRQERERANDLLTANTGLVDAVYATDADLSRAEETIEKELAKHVEREWRPLDGTYLGGTICNHCRRDYPCSTVQTISEYDKQKEADRGDR